MKTLIELYKWQITVAGFALYIVVEKGSWLNQVYQTAALTSSRTLIETTIVVVMATVIAVYVVWTIWGETHKPSSNRKNT